MSIEIYGKEQEATPMPGGNDWIFPGSDIRPPIEDDWALYLDPMKDDLATLQAGAAAIMQEWAGITSVDGRIFSGREQKALDPREYYQKAMKAFREGSLDSLWSDEYREFHEAKARGDKAAMRAMAAKKIKGEGVGHAVREAYDKYSQSYLADVDRGLNSIRDALSPEELAILDAPRALDPEYEALLEEDSTPSMYDSPAYVLQDPRRAAVEARQAQLDRERFDRHDELYRKHHSEIEGERRLASYERQLEDENLWAVIKSLKGHISNGAQRVVDMALQRGNEPTSTAVMNEFEKLSTPEQRSIAGILQALHYSRGDGGWTLARDAGNAFMDTLESVTVGAVRGASDLVRRTWMDGDEYRDMVERRVLLEDANRERMNDWGYLGNTVICVASTIPYMAAAAVPYVGMADMMLAARDQFQSEAMRNGVDVSDPSFILGSSAFAVAYAYVEKIQWERMGLGSLGKLTNLSRRQMYCDMFHSVRAALGVAGAVAGSMLTESGEEGIQRAMEVVVEKWGGATLADAVAGFTEDFVQSLGTMAILGAVGAGRQHIAFRHGALGYDKADAVAAQGRSVELERLVLGHPGEVGPLASYGRTYGRMVEHWLNAGTDADTRQAALRRWGLDAEQAQAIHGALQNVWTAIEGADTSAETKAEQKSALVGGGHVLTAAELVAQIQNGSYHGKVETLDNGAQAVDLTIAGRKLRIVIEPKRDSAVIDPNDASMFESIVNALNERNVLDADGAKFTVEGWKALSPEERQDIIAGNGLVNQGHIELFDKNGNKVASMDGRVLDAITGRVTLTDAALPQTAFHETIHGVLNLLTNMATGEKSADGGWKVAPDKDAAALIGELSKLYPAQSAREAVNEEALADAFQAYLTGKIDVVEHTGLLDRLGRFLANLFGYGGKTHEFATPRTAQQRLFNTAITGHVAQALQAAEAQSSGQERDQAGTLGDQAPAQGDQVGEQGDQVVAETATSETESVLQGIEERHPDLAETVAMFRNRDPLTREQMQQLRDAAGSALDDAAVMNAGYRWNEAQDRWDHFDKLDGTLDERDMRHSVAPTRLVPGADLSDPETARELVNYFKTYPGAKPPKRLTDASPAATYAWFRDNLVGKTFKIGDRTFAIKEGHYFRFVCETPEGDRVRKGWIERADSPEEARRLVEAGEVSAGEIAGFVPARAASLPFAPEIFTHPDAILTKGHKEYLLKKFETGNANTDVAVFLLNRDGETLGLSSIHMREVGVGFLNGCTLAAFANEGASSPPGSLARDVLSPTDDARDTSAGTPQSQTPNAPDVNSENPGRHQVAPRLPSPEFAMDGTVADALPAHLREDARAIIAERANTSAWMVEPDGTPTDLNERDWLRREAEKRHEAGRRFAISGLYTGSAADYAQRDEDGNIVNGPSLHYVGTGETTAAFGYGLYASARRDIAESYMRNVFYAATEEYERKHGDDAAYPYAVFIDGKEAYWDVSRTGIGNNAYERDIALNTLADTGSIGEAIAVLWQEYKKLRQHRGFDWYPEKKIKAIEWLKSNREHLKCEPLRPQPHLYEQTFFTNRKTPEETERHLLKWYETVPEEQLDWVAKQWKKEKLNSGAYTTRGTPKKGLPPWLMDDWRAINHHTGEELYKRLQYYFESAKAASEFLSRAGIDGVKMPVRGFQTGGATDGNLVGWNYVSFRDDNIRVDHKWSYGSQRYQIAGRAGAERLGIRGLGDAEAMERSGATREEIWRETGWWRGADGMWRVEIGDIRFKRFTESVFPEHWEVPPHRAFERLVFANLDKLQKMTLEERITFLRAKKVKAGTPSEKQARDIASWVDVRTSAEELLAKELKARDEFDKVIDNAKTLGDLLDGPIFDAYPGLKNVRLEWKTREELGGYGGWAGIDYIAAPRGYGANLLSTLSHEIAHHVQRIEGLTPGSHPQTEMERIEADRLYESSTKQTLADLLKTLSRGLKVKDVEQEIDRETRIHGATRSWSRVAKSIEQKIKNKKLTKNESADLFCAIEDYANAREDAAPHGEIKDLSKAADEAYMAAGGEVEARMVEARLGLTEEQRKEIPPWVTEAVVRQDTFAEQADHSYAAQSEMMERMASGRHSVVPRGAQKEAGTEYPDAGAEIGGARFAVGRGRRAEYERLLAKHRPDLDAGKVLAELDKYGNPKKEKAALHWVVRGTVILPEDEYKVDDALAVAEKAKVDPFAYDSPMALLQAHKEFKPPTHGPIDPDTVPELSDKRDLGYGVTTYLVQDDEAGQKAMREILNAAYGKDFSPWCLLHGDGKGGLSSQAWGYWHDTYNSLPKRVAFQNGKPIAFMATRGDYRQEQLEITFEEETGLDASAHPARFKRWMRENGYSSTVPEQWWDTNDNSHEGIPALVPVEGDPLGRVHRAEIQGDGTLEDWPGGWERHSDGIDEEWVGYSYTRKEKTAGGQKKTTWYFSGGASHEETIDMEDTRGHEIKERLVGASLQPSGVFQYLEGSREEIENGHLNPGAEANLFGALQEGRVTFAEGSLGAVAIQAKIDHASGEWDIQHKGDIGEAELRRKFDAWREKFEALMERPADSIGPEERNGRDNGDGRDGRRYSIQAFADGTRFVHVDTDQALFDNAKEKDYPKIARRIILNRFRGKVVGGEKPQNAYVKTETAGEFAYPAKPLPREENSAKMRSAGELGNLLAVGEFAGHKPDDGTHPEATGGWDYYNSIFEVGGKFFAGKVNILINKRGRVFHDVTDVKENSQGLKGQHGKPRALFPASDIGSQAFPGPEVKSEGVGRGSVAGSDPGWFDLEGQLVAAEREARETARHGLAFGGARFSNRSWVEAFAARDKALKIERSDEDYERLIAALGLAGKMTAADARESAEALQREVKGGAGVIADLVKAAEKKNFRQTVEKIVTAAHGYGMEVGANARQAWERFLSEMRRTAKGRDAADFTNDTGWDLAELLWAANEAGFELPRKGKPAAAEGAPQEAGGATDEEMELEAALIDGREGDLGLTAEEARERLRKLAEERMGDVEGRRSRLRAALEAWRKSEAARIEKLRAEREAKESAKATAEADATAGMDDRADAEGKHKGERPEEENEDEAVEEMPDFKAFCERLKAEGLDLENPGEVAYVMRWYVEDWMAKKSGKAPGEVLKDPVAAAQYRRTVVQLLRDAANKLLDPNDGIAAKTVERMIGEIPGNATANEIQSRSRSIIGFIKRNAIRQSRKQLVKGIQDDIQKQGIKGKNFDETEKDIGRKITGEREAYCRYLKRILNWGSRRIAAEQQRLNDIITGRLDAYKAARGEDAALEALQTTDREIHRATERLNALHLWGGLRSKSPGEIARAGQQIHEWLEKERDEHEKRWAEWMAHNDEMAARIVQAVSAGMGDYTPDDPGAVGQLADLLTTNFRSRLERLAAGSGAEGRRAIDEVMMLVYAGSERLGVLKAQRRQRTDAMLARCVEGTGQTVGEFLKSLDENIPDELNRRLTTEEQPTRMTWGQALQLLGSLEQTASYKRNIDENGRGAVGLDGEEQTPHRDLILQALADKPQMLRLVEEMRKIYDEDREAISREFFAVTGNAVLTPDPLYLPARMFTGARENLETTVRAWNPFGPAFTPRIANKRDFDLSASIMDVYNERMKETATALAFGMRGMELRSVLARKSVQEAIARTHGKFALRKMIAHLTDIVSDGYKGDGGQLEGYRKAIRAVGDLTTYSALSWNVVTMLKQMTSIPAWTALLDGGYGEIFRHIVHFDAEAAKELMAAPGFTARYGAESFARMFRQELENPQGGNVLARLYKAGMTAVQMGDFVPGILVGTGVYKARKLALMRKGLSEGAAREQAARETWGLIEENQQSSRLENTPEILRRGGFIGRQLSKFASSPMMQVGHEIHTLRMWLAEARLEARHGGKESGAVKAMLNAKGDDAARWRKRFVNQFICNHVLMPGAMYAIATLFKAALGGEPPDKDEVFGDLVMQMVAGPWSRIFLLGAVADTTGEWAARLLGGKPNVYSRGDLAATQHLHKAMSNAGRLLGDAMDADWASCRDDFVKMVSSYNAPFRYAATAVQNATGYDPVQARRQRKREIAKREAAE